MDIKQLKYFMAIADVQSFSEASKRLYVYQPTLSKSMKNLEEKLGVELFCLVGKKVQVTDYGKRLYQKAQLLIEQYDALYNEIRDLTTLQTGVIRIGIPPIIGTCVFPGLIDGFLQKYPGVELAIDQHGAKNIQERVYRGKLDLGLTIRPVMADAFDVIDVVSDKNVLIVPPNHPLAGRTSVRYQELESEKFIFLDDEYMLTSNVVAGCREAGFEPRTLLQVTQWDFAVQLVNLNMGISVLPRRILAMYSEPGVVQIQLDHSSSAWDVVMVTKKGQYQSFATQAFMKYIQENAGTQQ